MTKWLKSDFDLIREFIDSGKSLDYIADHFKISKNNLKVLMSRNQIFVKSKNTNRNNSLVQIKQGKIKDYAYRLMVLNGEAVKQQETIQPYSDEQLKRWSDINQFSNDLLVWENKPLTFLDYQKEMIKLIEDNKYSLIVSGHQVGKDMIASALTLWKCVTIPNYFTIIVSPSQRQSDELFKRIQHFTASSDIFHSVKTARADELIFSNGSRILSLPSRGSITGLTHVNLVIVNEAGKPELPESIINDCMPMTMAVNGKLVLMGNPYSKTTEFYKHFQSPLFKSMHIRTEQNISLPDLKQFLESEKRRCSKKEYLQRYEGVFCDFDNAFISNRLLDVCVSEYDYSLKRNPELKYFVGIDWGIKCDESVLVVISKSNDGSLRVEYAESWSGQSLRKCSNKLIYLDNIYHFETIIPEEAGLSLDEVRWLKESVVGGRVKPFVPTNERNWEGYKSLLTQFEQNLITLPLDEIELINQLRYLELKQTQTGKFKVEGKQGEHDDFCSSLMIAVSGATQKAKESLFLSFSR